MSVNRPPQILDMDGLALDRDCQACTGKRFVVCWREWWDQLDEPASMMCVECTWIGFVPTPQGAAILALMRRYRPWA